MATLTDTMIQGGVLREIKLPKYFYQGLFGQQFLAKSDVIIFDDVYEDYRSIAKFVSPNVIATVNQTKTFDVKSFRPAYVKERDVIEAWSETLQARTAGEEIGGSLTPQERAMKMRAKQLAMQRLRVENLIELMCFQALSAGKLVIRANQYPTTTIDYFRHADLTATTLGVKNWATPTNNPLESLATMCDKVYEHSQEEVDTLIMGRTAWANFYKYITAKERIHLLDNNVRGSDLNTNLFWVGDVDGVSLGARFTSLTGQTIEVYRDTRSYRNADGQVTPYLTDNEVIGLSSKGFKGVQAFGAIKDADAGYMPARMHHKEYRTPDPSSDYLLTQSAPLPIVLNPNSVFRILNVNA